MARKRKSASRSARAGSNLKVKTSEAIEPSSSVVRASKIKTPLSQDPSSTRHVKRAVNQRPLSMLNKLYFYCTRRPKAHEESSVLVSMFGICLNRMDSYTLRPKGWVSNMVILVAGKIMMEEEKATNGVVTRHIFSPLFMTKVICDSNLSSEDSYRPWCIEDVYPFVLQSKLGYDVCECKWPKTKTLCVLDSMGGKLSTGKKNLDDATKLRFEELLVIMNPSLTKENASITLVHVDVPVQPNNHDCGIHALKYMETWDGSIKWQDKTMLEYSYKEILEFRQSFICGWVQHPKNEVRDEILKKAGAWGKLN